MPMVVAGLAARWAFNDQYGLINDLIRRFVPNFHYDWLVHANSAQGAVIAVDLWKDLPFFAILVLAALQFYQQIFMRQQKSMEQDRYELFLNYTAKYNEDNTEPFYFLYNVAIDKF